MPFVIKKLESENVNIAETKTLILDMEKTSEIEKGLGLSKGLTYKEALDIKEKFSALEGFKGASVTKDSNWLTILKQIDNIEEFYSIIWDRTILELMFISQYYISLISNPQSFEQVLLSGDQFDFWFDNNVKYNMLEKIKKFYLVVARIYANKTSIDIFETDVEAKAKIILDEIENNHLVQVKEFLRTTWETAAIRQKEWDKKQEMKRKTIIFD